MRLGRPSLPFLYVPFPCVLPFLLSNGTRSRGAPSVNAFYPVQLLINGIDAKLVCVFCLKTDGAPPSSTHSCIFYNPNRHVRMVWIFCSCSEQELGGSCCVRRICRSCIDGHQQQTIGSVQQPIAMVQWPMLPTSVHKRAQACIDISSEKYLMSCSE